MTHPTTREEIAKATADEFGVSVGEMDAYELAMLDALVDARLALQSSEATVEKELEAIRKLNKLVQNGIEIIQDLRSQLSSAEQTIAGLKEERYKELKEFFHFVHSQWLFKYGGKIWGEDMLAAYLKSKEGVPDKPKEGGA